MYIKRKVSSILIDFECFKVTVPIGSRMPFPSNHDESAQLTIVG